MTTERSGMSLENSVVNCLSELMRGLEIPPRALVNMKPEGFYVIGRAIAAQAKANGEHLSHDDQMVDHIAKMVADRVGNGMREKYIDLAYRIVESFAARHAAAPDEIDLTSAPVGWPNAEAACYAAGWNACRATMLANRREDSNG